MTLFGATPRSIMANLATRGDLALALGVMAIIVVLILPLPLFLLDFSLAISITFSVLVLMTALLHPEAAGIQRFSDSAPDRHHAAAGAEPRIDTSDPG